MIVLDQVVKTYEKNSSYTVRALKGVSLHIEDGEFVFLVGNSGSGKSTILRLLLRELKATSGSVQVDGMALEKLSSRKLPKYRRKLGVVFQDFRLLGDRNVYENVALAQRVIAAPVSGIRKAVPAMLNQVGLASRYKSYPAQLSGGEQQRVAIARALVNKPEILLCDEPTGNLDPDNTREIMRLLLQANEAGTTVVVVTHNMEMVRQMGKRVITLSRGVITGDTSGRDGAKPAKLELEEPEEELEPEITELDMEDIEEDEAADIFLLYEAGHPEYRTESPVFAGIYRHDCSVCIPVRYFLYGSDEPAVYGAGGRE